MCQANTINYEWNNGYYGFDIMDGFLMHRQSIPGVVQTNSSFELGYCKYFLKYTSTYQPSSLDKLSVESKNTLLNKILFLLFYKKIHDGFILTGDFFKTKHHSHHHWWRKICGLCSHRRAFFFSNAFHQSHSWWRSEFQKQLHHTFTVRAKSRLHVYRVISSSHRIYCQHTELWYKYAHHFTHSSSLRILHGNHWQVPQYIYRLSLAWF